MTIRDAEAKPLAEFLSTNHELEDLIMTEHAMSDEGCAALGKALESNTALQCLSLKTSNKSITSTVTGFLIKGLKDNCELIQLDLPDHEEWPERITQKLNVYLERNRVLTPLLKADLPLGLWPHILQRARLCDLESPDMLYALVKEKCDLFRSVPITQKRKRRRIRR